MTIALYATIHAVQLHCNYFKHTYEARVEASQSLKSRSSHSRKGPGKPRFDEENSRPIQLDRIKAKQCWDSLYTLLLRIEANSSFGLYCICAGSTGLRGQ